MSYKARDLQYRTKQAERTKSLWENGIYSHLISPLVTRKCINSKCELFFQIKPHDPKKFCSKKCASTVNNQKRKGFRIKVRCLSCGGIPNRNIYKYCSNKCQQDFEYSEFIKRWQQGLATGSIGVTTKTLSGYIRRYLFQKYQEKCSLCGWDKKHPLTQHVPVEIDHIDGDSDNNKEENLRLICPNCHSLTTSFRNLNKGHGRSWRLTYIAEHKPAIN